jgi:hypothetical protein
VGSQIMPLHFAAGVKSLRYIVQQWIKSMMVAEIFPLHNCSWETNFPTTFCNGEIWLTAASGSGESNLTTAWCSGESNLTTAWCSGESIWHWGVKSKNFGRFPRPLKGQTCKKTITYGDLHYSSPMRIMY